MTDTQVVQLGLHAMIITAKLSAPILIVSLVAGLAISLLQSVTQIQEVTLTFVPKLLGVAVVLLVAGHWMLNELVSFTTSLFDGLPALLR
jgi:flagellar biosynthetic protein FliQ